MKIPKDKWLHFSISAALTILLSFLLSWIAACILVFGLGLLKELADRYLFKGHSALTTCMPMRVESCLARFCLP